ncbi:MAG: bile acid:sodium symporter family protein [Desulfobacteraceae bacterium]
MAMRRLWRNRDFILILALTLGLGAGQLAAWTERLVLPALAVVMTLSTMGVSGEVFRSPRALVTPVLVGLAMNFLVLGGVLLGLSYLLVADEALFDGFILLVAVPPAVAVIPFTSLLHGDSSFSLIGTIGAYLGALIITPLIAVALLGTAFIHPVKLILIMVELILIPLVLSRLLLWSKLSARLVPVKGAITNWSFFVIVYTIVGLNRELFLGQPLSLLPVALIAVASTFLLGEIIACLAQLREIKPPTITSLVLLGTLKNYALAGGLALSLFSQQTAVPATVSTIFMIVYIIWLNFKKRLSTK